MTKLLTSVPGHPSGSGAAISHRFGPVLLLVWLVAGISLLTRLAFTVQAAKDISGYWFSLPLAFLAGLFYDLVNASYLCIPFVLHICFQSDTLYSRPWRFLAIGGYLALLGILQFTSWIPLDFSDPLKKVVTGLVWLRLLIFVFLLWRGPVFRKKWRRAVLQADFFLVIFLLLFNAVSEWFFWNEFSSRYNFIAVDYLLYTNEVVGNIRESYPLGRIIAGLLLLTFLVWRFFVYRLLGASLDHAVSVKRRLFWAACFLMAPLLAYFCVNGNWKATSRNNYVNEIGGNGLYDFGAAFLNNELDYFSFYPLLPDKEAFALLRRQLQEPYSRYISRDSFSIERMIDYPEPEKRMNVVLISVESLSGDFMDAFGSNRHITPFLDSLARESVFFTSLYATGTRTVRGLESLSMGIAPTPGQSMVKRPGNGGMFTLGSVFRSRGYSTQYIYGGYSYFDNMKTFFAGNGYQVIDRDAIPVSQVHYANIWGVCDEDLFTLGLKQLDSNAASGRPFFTHIMTVSNHRPFTYPDGRIDIPSAIQSREGGVKYTDYALGKFIGEARQKPWFANTVFVIVSDHCASSAGRVSLPVNRYQIPLLIYSPGNLMPQRVNRLMSQVDIAPTVLGLLNMDYRSKFFGYDIFRLPPGRERAFISTYQSLGFIRDSVLTVISPVRKSAQFRPDFRTGLASPAAPNDSLLRQTMAWFQCASWLLKHGGYKAL